MDKSGIATSILSIAQPGIWYGNNLDESRKLARDLNEYGTKVVKDHPGRFGLFACIAPPDVDGSLREIEYAMDTLKADGIGLLTSYQDKYLGDPSFAPIYAELNRRKAVVYVHPTTPDCCRGLVPGIPPGLDRVRHRFDPHASRMWCSADVPTKFPDIRGSSRIAAERSPSSPPGSSSSTRCEKRTRTCRTARCRNSRSSITSWRRAIRPGSWRRC